MLIMTKNVAAKTEILTSFDLKYNLALGSQVMLDA